MKKENDMVIRNAQANFHAM